LGDEQEKGKEQEETTCPTASHVSRCVHRSIFRSGRKKILDNLEGWNLSTGQTTGTSIQRSGNKVPFTDIWTQDMNDNQPCCFRNFDRRVILVVNSDFEEAEPDVWSIFYVSGSCGQSEGHYFHKVVVIPQGTYGYDKRCCTSRGWKFEGSISPRTALEDLEEVLYKFLNMDNILITFTWTS